MKTTPQLYTNDNSFQAKYQNPDWSFKDRLNPTFKSQEAPLGAKNQRIN